MSVKQKRVTPKRPIAGYKKPNTAPSELCEHPDCEQGTSVQGSYAWYKKEKLKWICYRCARVKAVII